MDIMSTESKTKVYNCDEAVDLTGHGKYNYLMLATCGIINVGVALDMFGFSVVAAAGGCDLGLAVTQTGMLASVPFAGTFCAFPWGYYADTRGRWRALLLSNIVGFTFAVLSSFSPNWQTMLVLKLIGTAFSTASLTLTMTYLGECIASAVRNRFLMYMSAMNLCSEGIFYILAYFILHLDFRFPIPWLSITFRPWRLYTIILALPLGLGAVMLVLCTYESPKFLASRGYTEKALCVLQNIYKCNGGKKCDYPVKILFNDVKQKSYRMSFWKSIAHQTLPLFKPPLLKRTLQLFYLIALACSTNNIFLMWYPMMVNQFFNSLEISSKGDKSFCERVVYNLSTLVHEENYICNDTISTNTIYAGILLGVTFGFLGLVISLFSRWRKQVFLSIFTVSAFCLILTNLLRQPVINMIVFTLIQITCLCMGIVGSYFIDMFPTSHRAMAASLSMMFTRILSLVAVNTVGAVIADYCHVTFYVCTAFICSGIVIALFLPSDTKLRKQISINDLIE